MRDFVDRSLVFHVSINQSINQSNVKMIMPQKSNSIAGGHYNSRTINIMQSRTGKTIQFQDDYETQEEMITV